MNDLGPWWILIAAALLLGLELLARGLVFFVRGRFQWLITFRDLQPAMDPKGLAKFVAHGYDPVLGWVRKPNTSKVEHGKYGKTSYQIDAQGSRANPGHEALPKRVSFYGDSFIFGRQTNDDETLQWHFSKLTQTNVLNFGVGNYGLDQALLRLEHNYAAAPTPLVVVGVVPSTIVRILSVWKHYNEFGNIFGFKPRYELSQSGLRLIPNPIDSVEKFAHYGDYLPQIQSHDYFYERKFKREMLTPPYLLSLVRKATVAWPMITAVLLEQMKPSIADHQLERAPISLVMARNLKLRLDLFQKNGEGVQLLRALLVHFWQMGQNLGFQPVFMLMPQKDDLLFIKAQGPFYKHCFQDLPEELPVLDLADGLLAASHLDDLYSDDSHYGGHFSVHGNRLAAQLLLDFMSDNHFLTWPTQHHNQPTNNEERHGQQ